MADMIKDFVKKQTSTLTIGVPKPRTEVPAPAQAPAPDVRQEPAAQISNPEKVAAVVPPVTPKKPIGRPKSDVVKVKMSVYVPEELKARLVKVQHETYKSNLNDVLIEAVRDILDKYGA